MLFICCKTKLKKKFFLKKHLCFLQNICYLQKKCFYTEKKFIEKNINENVKKYIYISFQKYIFTQKMSKLQTKYKSFLNMYSFCKKKFF